MRRGSREFKYFADFHGEIVELTDVRHDGHVSTAAKHFEGFAPDGFTKLTANRKIDYKVANPSLHKCDARCTTATGHKCECSCGGKFHGSEA